MNTTNRSTPNNLYYAPPYKSSKHTIRAHQIVYTMLLPIKAQSTQSEQLCYKAPPTKTQYSQSEQTKIFN